MKKLSRLFFIAALTVILAASCGSVQNYYQLGTISPVDSSVKTKDNTHYFADRNIVIRYDFWAEYGKIACEIENVSDKDITVHFDKSYFIKDTYAYDYFGSTKYTGTEAGAATASVGGSMLSMFMPTANAGIDETANTVSINIPANSVKIVSEINMLASMYRDCDVLLYGNAKKGEKTSMNFSPESTPVFFENRFTYTVDGENDEYKVNNRFYISNILNTPESMYMKNVVIETELCPAKGTPVVTESKVVLPVKANGYYIKYNTGTFGTSKH